MLQVHYFIWFEKNHALNKYVNEILCFKIVEKFYWNW